MTSRGFRLWSPLAFFEKASAPAGEKRRIAGIISTELPDKQDEVVLQQGLDFRPFLRGGWFNDNHRQDTTAILGYPKEVQRFRKGERLPDGSVASCNGTWAEGHLLDTPDAQKVWELGKALASTDRRLGFSIEGKVVARSGPDGKTVAKAVVRNVAVTNCFPGTVRVSGTAKGVTRRWYSGPMVEITLATGEVLAGTPNHPVLTQRGWVPLGDLNEGQDCVGRFNRDMIPPAKVTHDVEDVPATLHEVFDLAASTGIETHPIRKGDFHGDVLIDGNVEVVLPDSLLKDRLHAAFSQKFGQHALALPDEKEGTFPVPGPAFLLKGTGALTAPGGLGSQGEGSALLGSSQGILPAILVRDGAVDSSTGHHVMDDGPIESEARRQFSSPLSEAIGFSNLLCKRSYEFSGHVFNLQTGHGWYAANGVVAHNCPVGEETRMEVLAKSLTAAAARFCDACDRPEAQCVCGPGEAAVAPVPGGNMPAGNPARKAMTMGIVQPGVNPSARGPVTGEGTGAVVAPQSLEEKPRNNAGPPVAGDASRPFKTGEEDAEKKKRPLTKSMAVATIQNRLGAGRETAERAYGALLHLKQQGLL